MTEHVSKRTYSSERSLGAHSSDRTHSIKRTYSSNRPWEYSPSSMPFTAPYFVFFVVFFFVSLECVLLPFTGLCVLLFECVLSLECVLLLEYVLLHRHMLDKNALSLFLSLMSLHADSVIFFLKKSTLYSDYTRDLTFDKL